MTLRDYASKNYDLIISHGFEWGDPTIKVAKDYPNTKLIGRKTWFFVSLPRLW